MKFVIILTILLINSLLIAEPFVRFEAGNSTLIKEIFFTEVELGYKLKIWRIESRTYGGWLTWADRNKNYINGSPIMDIYTIGQKFNYQNFFVHWKHYCAHSVNSNKTVQRDQKGNIINTSYEASPYWWSGNMDTVSIGFEFNFK